MRAVATIAFLFLISSVSTKADNYMERCPCGPDSIRGPLRLLLPQGHKGADFRESCRKHDACYDTLGEPRKQCDDQFLEDLLAACEHSKHPKMARFKAKLSYWVVSKFGNNAYRSAQQLAANAK